MGQKTRHFLALMKKNWIVWKRTLGASLCELICPIILMSIMVLARALVDHETIQPISNMKSGSLESASKSFSEKYGEFANFTQTDAAFKNPLGLFVPDHCIKRGNDPATPIIAMSGPAKYLDPLERDLNQLISLQKQTNALTQVLIMQNNTLKARLQAAGINPGVDVDLKINRNFSSHQDISDYLNSRDYLQNEKHQGLCFGFSITESKEDELEIQLMFSAQFQDPKTQSIPSQINDAWSEFEINADMASFKRYTTKGYSILQNWIANSVLRVKSGNKNASIAFTVIPFKTDQYIKDDFKQIMTGMLPFFMLLTYILPVYRLISNVVAEKESKARESMKMMGLNDFSYWMSWWVYYSIIVTIISGLVIGVLSINVLSYSNRGLVFLLFWVYGLSLFGLSVFLQAFFSKARVAAIAGTLVYFGTSFINTLVQDPLIKGPQKTLASLLTTVAISRGCNNLAQFEVSGVGIQNDNMLKEFQHYSLGNCLIMMTISLFLFFFVGIWLDNVLPTAFGLRKPWYFCLSPNFCCSTRKSKRLQKKISPRADIISKEISENDESETLFEAKYMKRENFEPAARDLIRQEQEGKILRITDLKKTFDNGFQAVRGVNLKIYNNQIFALLGHNGAGKTTTISMLTGLLTSTEGMAEVFGVDMFEDMDNVRQFLGVCPQHDILFDLLTPEEHLDIFCDFKGVDPKRKNEEIKKMLLDVDVHHFKDIVAENLSGGSRRKLSVAIALIGGSKLVLLDEPTSGMDLTARRKLWNMLKNYKQNRIIILTTHYMDEADILGDRIGIMTGGQLICLGSSLFLKNRFGVGYNFTMVKKTKDQNSKIGKYLEKHLGDSIKLLSEVSSEITYQIPNALSVKFKDFFGQFDQDLESLDIESYGISVTTLEEVFLKVGHGDDSNEDKGAIDLIKSQKGINQLEDKNVEDNFSIADPKFHLSSALSFYEQLKALFLKRFFIFRRNRRGLIVEVLIPVLLVLIGIGFSKVQFFLAQPSRQLTPNLYPLKQRILSNEKPIISSSNSTFNIEPKTLLSGLPMYQDAFDVTYKSYSQYNSSNTTQQQSLAVNFDDDIFQNRLKDSYYPYRFGSFFIYEANNQTKQFKASIFINVTSQDVAAAYPQFMYEAILKQALGKPNFQFKVITNPFPVTEKFRQRKATGNGVFISFVVSIGFALIPAVVVSFILNEREKNLKHMQLISGMSLPAYWISNLIFDIAKGIIPSIIVIGLIYAFELGYNNVWLMFLLYPVAVVPFTYVMSFFFQSERVAQTITIFLHFVFAGIGAIIVFILRIIESTRYIGDVLIWVLKIVPSYCLTDTIMFDATKSTLFVIRPELKRESDFDIDLLGGNVLILCVHFIFWNIVLISIEMGAFNWTKKVINLLPKNQIPPKDVSTLALDEDVIQEDLRVESAQQEMQVKVHRFRKVYPSLFRQPVMAVERTSFGLQYGECFALLGINGAGKSTTFKALTSEIAPTSGIVTINGYEIQSQFSEARKLIGYCPQYDAIFELVTVEEHLEYYARIKGIPQALRQKFIERQIVDMNLTEHRKKPAGTLSGGNKRKLSVAMAIIGNPPIILLDEPSAGMDPEARRFMWSVVARISQQRKKSAVILTTHSMEEAEALSTKMGIMVKGGVFKCFGTSQHIKNKYGTGYEIEVKVKKVVKDELIAMAKLQGIQNEVLTTSNDLVSLTNIIEMMKVNNLDPFLISEIKIGGLGEDLIKESQDQGHGMIDYYNFLLWLYIEQAGMGIINYICEQFPTVEILEHYSDYYKLRVPRGNKSIGFVFGMIEGKKDECKISEYSVSQTTLEQIFQSFANLKLDEDVDRKLTFKKLHSSSKAELYIDRGDAELLNKIQLSNTIGGTNEP